jgi:predicted flap endonuclease-1-like 5' DNA nuclease
MIGRLVLLVAAAAATAGAAVFGRRRARQQARARRRAERQAKRARLDGAALTAVEAMAAKPLPDVAAARPAAAASEPGAEVALEGEAEGQAMGQIDQPGDAFTAIKGIGPAMEERLRATGVTSVAQVAAWSGDDIEAIAPRLKIRSERIRREAWVEQAQAMMAGQHAAG